MHHAWMNHIRRIPPLYSLNQSRTRVLIGARDWYVGDSFTNYPQTELEYYTHFQILPTILDIDPSNMIWWWIYTYFLVFLMLGGLDWFVKRAV